MTITMILKVRNVIAALQQEKVSVTLAYKFTKFLKETETEEIFYRTKMQEIMETYGEKDENGKFILVDNGVKIIEDKKDQCLKDLTELETTQIENFPSIIFTLNELGDLKLTTEDMNSLFEFIKEN